MAITSRPYDSNRDLEQMYDLLMEGRARTGDWRYWHVGELAFSFLMVDCHLTPQEHIRLWHDEGVKLVGYAILGEDPTFDFQVSPGHAWTGIEAAALDWAQTLLGLLRQADAKRWGGKLITSARQDDAARIAFLEGNGFRRGEYAEVNFLLSLEDPIPTAVLPTGCLVREVAGEADLPDRAAIQREVWHPWTVGEVSDEDYARFMQMPGYRRELDLITLAPDGTIAAYVNGWIDLVNRIGDFGPVGARAAYRRQGMTRAALVEGLHRMRACGMERMCISTGVNNTPARNLYQSLGFKPANTTCEYTKPT